MTHSRIGVVADSTTDFPSDWPYRDRLHIIPEYIRFNDNLYREGVDITETEFYEKVAQLGIIPKTSQPNPEEFANFYRNLSDRYDELISIHVSSKLSGTFHSATTSANMVSKDIKVHTFDSGGGSAGAGFMADEALTMIDAGASAHDILKRLETLQKRIQIFLSPNDLTYPRMSGRISALGAFIASVLHITPIIILTDGKLVAKERTRSRKKAIAKMIDMMKERLGDGPINIALVHAQAPQDIPPFEKAVREAFQPQKFWIATLSTSVAVHLGPGTIGIVGYRTD